MTPMQQLWIWIVAGFAGGLLLGGVLAGLWSRIRAQREREELRVQLAGVKARLDETEQELGQLEKAHACTEEENDALRIRLARQEEGRAADAEKLQWVEQAQTQMRDAFQALAGQTLQNQSGEFLKRAGEQVEGFLKRARGDWNTQRAEMATLFKPLQENLTTMQGHVRELEQKREGAYQGLQEQLRQLAETQAALQTTTVTLTQALKSPTVRGQWGELQLRRVVEMAGMVKHITFLEQVGTDAGRPDMIARLPNGGILPVDAKVPLAAYLEAAEATDEHIRKAKLAEHARAMQSRVNELGQKRYWEAFEQAPDFVVMFVPNEACLGAAFEQNPSLLEYAIGKRVLITTPVTLLALLKAAAFGWQQYQITDNALQIAEQGKELYRRLEVFTRHLAQLGRDIEKAAREYNRAVGSLARRLLPAARRFEELGIAATELEAPAPVETQARMPEGEE